MLSTLTRLKLLHGIDSTIDVIEGKAADPFAPYEEEMQMRALFYDAWQTRLQSAAQLIGTMHFSSFAPLTIDEISRMLEVFTKYLSGASLETHLTVHTQIVIRGAFDAGKRSVDAMYKKQTGHEPVVKSGELQTAGFGLLFGLTEEHAIQALAKQAIVSAGGFWDEQLSDSIKKELTDWFNADATQAPTREMLVEKMKSIVNERLSIEGKASLPRSYFDGLSEHVIVRSRNVGSFYRGKSLGAKEYQLFNPRDDSTSEICMKLTDGRVFKMASAETVVGTILGATSLSSLKASVPFLTAGNADDATAPVPPLHWRCRTSMHYIFADVEGAFATPLGPR